MKAVDLSLSHKCYYVTVNAINEVEIEGIISCEGRKDKMMVCFIGDPKHYVVSKSIKNIFNLYFFSYEDAVQRQKKLRLNALWAVAIKRAKAEEDYSMVMQKYQELKK